ncbi:ParB/RepB/Spo0J family partition protein [Meridianimarinicoccus sp. RP-17]|uniref:ParB/RepB/Spo0J family partition protein n=1 Tax=Meridianimarinicoccus zhengii TaxID=2056810 RepID=UPI000DAF0D72|nr:ParB N-terminal domain-containing protein [Phycocomes zhengii]
MAVEFLTTIHVLPVADVRETSRLRPVSEDAVSALVDAIGAHGFLTRILVRRTPGGDVLLDGAHRLEAMRRLERAEIPAVVVMCRDDEARLLEADANLVGADLTPLDLAVFLSARRRVYQEMHPETKQGAAGAAGRWMQETSKSLASTLAEARGISVRHVSRIMAAGDALQPDEIAKLRLAPRPVNLKDLQAISKIPDTVTRYDVVDALAEGRARTAAQAIAARKTPAAQPDPIDAAYTALCKAWDRAPLAARKRFVARLPKDLAKSLPKGGAV